MRTTDGTIEESRSGGFLLRFAQTYPTTPADLWAAVTRPDRLARWFAPVTGDLRDGGTWLSTFDDGTFFTEGTVTACEAPVSFTTTWHARDEDEISTITVSIAAAPDGASLRLDHDGVGSRDYGAGWQTYLELLELALADDGAGIAAFDWDARFAELAPRYRVG